MRKKVFLCIFVLLIYGCAGIQPNPSNPVYTIAVLPFYNATNSVEGPKKVRKEVWKSLRKRHYYLMPLEEVDTILMDRMGITLGLSARARKPGGSSDSPRR